MDDDKYINHEVRLQVLEGMVIKINNKISASLSLISTSLVIPLVLKWLGWS